MKYYGFSVAWSPFFYFHLGSDPGLKVDEGSGSTRDFDRAPDLALDPHKDQDLDPAFFFVDLNSELEGILIESISEPA